MSGNLGDMIVSFSADISGLVDGVSQAQNQLADFATVATDAADQITQLVSSANASDLTVQIDAATSSLTSLSTEVADSSSNLNGFVSDIDVAQAQLVLLQSKAADAATALQEMQAEASASGDYSGIAEAQAQLVLLQGKAQDAAASLQELQTAESDTSGSSGFGDAVSGMMSNLGNFGSSIGDGIGSLMSMGSQLGMTMMGFQMLGNMAQQTASALLTPAATAETTQLSFTTLMHSASAAKDEMTALNTYAASTPMQTQWVDDAASKFLAFGFNVKSVIPDINAIGDSLSGLGKLSAASLNSIVDIFGKIQAQGKLTGGDMMQLSDAGIPAWKALSEAMGKPIPILQSMVSKGLIPAKDALPALQKGMENIFGGGMAKQAQTFSGIMSTISSDWQIAMAALGGPLLKIAETGLSKLSDILASPAFQKFAADVGQKIADVLVSIGNFVKNTLYPDFVTFGTYIGSLAPKMAPVFASMWNGLQQVGNFLQQTFLPVWQQLGNTFNDQLVPAWNNFYNSIRPVMPELEEVAGWIGKGLVGAIALFVIDLAGMLKDSIIVFGGIAEIVSGWVTYVSGNIAYFVDLVTGQWGKLDQDTAVTTNGMQAMWVGAWNAIDGIFGSAINGLIDQVNGWLSGMVSSFNAVSTAIGGPAMHFSAIGHVSTIKLATPATQQATQQQAASQQQTNAAAAANPFTQFMNSLSQLTAPSSSSNSLPAAITSAASGTTAAVNGTTAAVNSASGKSAAAQQKAADSANATALRLAADQKKALADSSSSAVKALVAQSQAAAAKGDTTTAAFYASQADQLAAQQKAAATKATNASKSAAKKAATAKASAAKKAATAKAATARRAATAKAAAARAAAKKKTATASTPKTSTRGSSTGTTIARGTSTGVSTGTTTGTGTTTATGTSTTATGATTGTVPQTLTIVLEINGADFGTAVMPFVMTAAMQKVRLKTGLKI